VTSCPGGQSIKQTMPPHTFSSSARLLYAFTALVAVSIIATVGFAGAGQEEAQCKGN
jgi:hypothetical protein